ncbi:MAG: hypothetical protein ACI9IT_001827 [Glaciecola sp.]|jgi:hypothetical protein
MLMRKVIKKDIGATKVTISLFYNTSGLFLPPIQDPIYGYAANQKRK